MPFLQRDTAMLAWSWES